ncbi:Gemin6 [Pilobolus umbonatus]|nr:Gemin6 [Pilobolus umbonatus]
MTHFLSFTYDELDQHRGCSVTVTVNKNTQIEGYLYTVDPSTKNIVIYSHTQVHVIMSHEIRNIQLNSQSMDKTELDSLMEYHDNYSDDWMSQRRSHVIQLLEKYHIPIEYNENDPVIHVLGCARVESPYGATSVFSESELIRKRVRDILLELDNP